MRKQKLLFKEEQEKLGEWIRGKDYIAYFLSELRIGKNADDTIFSPQEELLEAHYFDDTEYVHVFQYKEEFCAVCFTDEQKEDCISEVHFLRNRDFAKVECRKYISYDEYGQAYIEMIRPVQLIGR